MKWQIRQAVLNDIEQLVSLDPIAAKEVGRRVQIEQAVATHECWVACAADDPLVPIGYGCLDKRFFGEWFISLVVVSDAHRRSGAGRQIVAHLEACTASKRIFTSTNRSNSPMRQLLEQLGYQRSGKIENLDLDDSELIFVKFLD
ncbi:GNAT family N-acetyltransferase [Pseudomonas fontis]|uniref:GNAT family N-acetyltransferase n=1 Tax=Pseudomonas fontis TaxID=2942633 RepID=A0ABT5NXJ1_9PSED|nr:GNAT family N-acetyltransferase [Pseudomonas fontis]MDD0973773.1 GNAT family N-acetyltransferase [Pseudomonas fontis]MDD0992907.1 GNAT family N-acetyltransferase [Pseudomonas fontis]